MTDSGRRLLPSVASSLFWNATLLPVVTFINLGASILIRRTFGLESGVYDVLVGISSTLLAYSSLGLPGTLPRFILDLEATVGMWPTVAFVRRVALLRMGLFVIPLLLLNAMTARVSAAFQLGEHGAFLLHAVTVLALGRAALDLADRTLHGLMAHRASNVIRGLQGVAVLVLVVAIRRWEGGIGALVIGTGAIALVAASLGGHVALGLARSSDKRQLGPDPVRQSGEFSPGLSVGRFWNFALLLYFGTVSGYFSGAGFASATLGIVSDGVEAVTLFNTGHQIPLMVSVVLLGGFQGLYVPLFGRLISTPDRLRTGYQEVIKVYAILLIPAGAGLLVMLGDYIPLLYGQAFSPAVPIARILTVVIFVIAFLGLGGIVLTAAELSRPVASAQMLLVLGAVPFVLAASTGDLVLTAMIFPAGRLLASGAKHLIARRRFELRFPVAFVARVTLPSLVMIAVLIPSRSFLGTSWLEAILLTVVGAAVAVIGMRMIRVLGPRELDLLERAELPGARVLVRLARGR